jgi:hypothetical protein
MTDDNGIENNNLDETRRAASRRTRHQKPVVPPMREHRPPQARRQPQAQRIQPDQAQSNIQRRPPPRPGTARHRRDNALYLPLWSLIVMLMCVMVTAATIVLLVIGLRGGAPEESAPVIIVSSPIPTERPESFPVSPATATIPPAYDDLGIIQPQPTIGLIGPTLPPVIFSPTPRSITVGENVIVVDVGLNQLNVRDMPGVNGTTIIFRADEGTIFTIIGGPQQSDGLTWWQIQNPSNPTLSGWAASNYLEITQ